MKKLLWKPGKISPQVHILIAIMALMGLVLVEKFKKDTRKPYYETKMEASYLMRKSMNVLKQYRVKNIMKINKKIDPANSGLIGLTRSAITTTNIEVTAKQTTLNPNWAAVVVSMIRKAKVKEGSLVAVSLTSSFPAINLAVLSAIKTLKLEPIIITSLSSSTWGANIPNFTWLDMERVLYKEGVFPYRSIACSLGGAYDLALGLPEKGLKVLKDTARKNNVPLILFEGEERNENLHYRMNLYYDHAKNKAFALYINVGGGTISVGSYLGKRRYKPGLTIRASEKAMQLPSVISSFAKKGIPVINLNYFDILSKQYGMPPSPKKMPEVGEGEIFIVSDYNKILTAGVLLILIGILYVFIKMDVGYRIFSKVEIDSKKQKSEQMV